MSTGLHACHMCLLIYAEHQLYIHSYIHYLHTIHYLHLIHTLSYYILNTHSLNTCDTVTLLYILTHTKHSYIHTIYAERIEKYEQNSHRDSNIEVQFTGELDARKDDLFSKGQSKRIWAELYKV